MDMDMCSMCYHSSADCGGRTKRQALSFSFSSAAYLMVSVPCCAKQRLDDFLDGKRLVVTCPRGHKYDLFVEQSGTLKVICGPFWRQLVQAYDIKSDDVVRFCFDPQELEKPDEYEVTITDATGRAKAWAIPDGVAFSCRPILSWYRKPFEKTIFSNILDISDEDMCEVTWAIIQELRNVFSNDTEDFYETAQFFVHRVREEDLNQLNIPAEIATGYTFPCHGRTILCSKQLAEELYGSYVHHKGHPITLGHAWAEFSAELGLAVGSLIMMKVEIRDLAIKVDVKILPNN